MLKIVIDTNLFIKGLLKSKTARLIIEAFIEERFKLISSEYLIGELIHTSQKPNLRKFITEDDAALLIALIKEKAIIVKPKGKINLCRDEKDNPIIETAITAKAEYIITSDKDILEIPPEKLAPLKTISPEEFLDILKR